jgi:hypothetical protein
MRTEAGTIRNYGMRLLELCCAALGLALLPSVSCHSQASHPQPQQPYFSDRMPAPDIEGPPARQRRQKLLEIERQKSLVADTNKLLKLAAALNAEVSTANPDDLTPSQRNTVAQIEKLARDIRQKMSYAEISAPNFGGPGTPGSLFIQF